MRRRIRRRWPDATRRPRHRAVREWPSSTPRARSLRSSFDHGKRLVETVHRLVDLGRRDRQRRQQPHDRLAVALTSSPSGRAASTIADAGRSSSRPRMTPAPRTSCTIGCAAARPCRRASKCAPTERDVRQQVVAEQLVDEVQPGAAGQQVAAVRAAVVARRDRPRDGLAQQRRANGDAAAKRLADRDQVAGPGQARSSRTACPVRPRPLCTSSAMTSVPVRSHTARRAATNAGRQRTHAAFALNGLDDDGRGLVGDGRGERVRIGRVARRSRPAPAARTARGSAGRP